MNASDILTLARAGFTAQQIAALAAAPAQSGAAIAAVPAQSSAPAPAATPASAPSNAAIAAAPAQSSAPAAAQDPMQQLLAQMGALTQAVQANAILAAGQPKQETADDILAQIIAPPIPKANDK